MCARVGFVATRRLAVVLCAVLLCAACGGSGPSVAADAEIVTRPGSEMANTILVGDTELSFSIYTPPGFSNGDTAPVLLALPPGDQTQRNVAETMRVVYVPEAERRGWVVVSPIAPDGVRFFEGSEELLPPLLDFLEETIVVPEGGRVHLGGMSNGGVSAIRLAADEPGRFASISVYPGAARTSADRDALADIAGVPISVFVGSQDTAWVGQSETLVEALREGDALVTYRVIPGEDHVLESLWGRTSDLWDAFTDARLSATG